MKYIILTSKNVGDISVACQNCMTQFDRIDDAMLIANCSATLINKLQQGHIYQIPAFKDEKNNDIVVFNSHCKILAHGVPILILSLIAYVFSIADKHKKTLKPIYTLIKTNEVS